MDSIYALIGIRIALSLVLFSLFSSCLHLKSVSVSQDELQVRRLSWSESCVIQILTLAMFPGNNVSERLRSEKNPSFSFVVKSCGSQNPSRVGTETKDLKIGVTSYFELSYFLVFAQTVAHFKYSKRQNKRLKKK